MSQRFFEGALHAAAYAKFRPVPPSNLGPLIVNYLKEKVTNKHLAELQIRLLNVLLFYIFAV